MSNFTTRRRLRKNRLVCSRSISERWWCVIRFWPGSELTLECRSPLVHWLMERLGRLEIDLAWICNWIWLVLLIESASLYRLGVNNDEFWSWHIVFRRCWFSMSKVRLSSNGWLALGSLFFWYWTRCGRLHWETFLRISFGFSSEIVEYRAVCGIDDDNGVWMLESMNHREKLIRM